MNNFKKIVAALVLFGAFVLVSPVLADNELDIEYYKGDNLNKESLFSDEDILPGWSNSQSIRIENDSNDNDADLYMKFDIEDGKTLAKALKVYVIQRDNGHYRIGGEGDRYNLKEAYKKGELFIDRISMGKGKDYKIKFVFDEEAGNEYQGLSTEFDMDFTFESREATQITPEQILTGQGRVVSPEISIPEIMEYQREQASQVEQTDIQGDANDRPYDFPWWLLLLLIILAITAYRLWKKYQSYKEEKPTKNK